MHFQLIQLNDFERENESVIFNPYKFSMQTSAKIIVEINLGEKEYYPQRDKIDFTVDAPKQ